MALRAAHGRARELGATEVFEAVPFDELPPGLPARYYPASGDSGRLRGEIRQLEQALAALAPQAPKGDALKLRGAIGGKRKALNAAIAAEQAQQVARLSTLADGLLPDVVIRDPVFASLLSSALELFQRTCSSLARDVGGGRIEDAEASMIENAALAWAASRACFASSNFKEAATMAELSSKMFGLGHEYAAKRAKLRGESAPTATVDGWQPALAARLVREAFGEHARPAGEGEWLAAGGDGEAPEPPAVTPKSSAPAAAPPELAPTAEPPRAPPVAATPAATKPEPPEKEPLGPWDIVQGRIAYQQGGPHGIGAGDPRMLATQAERDAHEMRRFAREFAGTVNDMIDSGKMPKI